MHQTRPALQSQLYLLAHYRLIHTIFISLGGKVTMTKISKRHMNNVADKWASLVVK